jgi:predicted amidophosphoribosyltransferase
MGMLDAVIQLVLPTACPGCGAPAVALCPTCERGLRPAPSAPPPAGLDWWVAAYAYEGALRELVARAKYRQARTGLPWLASRLAGAVRATLQEGHEPVDVVGWPPTTPARRRRRGFDPAEVLARAVARRLGLPVRTLLVRTGGDAQTGRRRAERRQGPGFAAAGAVAGRRVLLVDDVATTGATMAAAAGALRAAGAVGVAGATAGRTPLQVGRMHRP